jgi:hypothetical protein
MPTAGEYKDKYVSVGFINFYDNELTSSSTEEDKALTVSNLMADLESLKLAQVSKHLTTENAKEVFGAL